MAVTVVTAGEQYRDYNNTISVGGKPRYGNWKTGALRSAGMIGAGKWAVLSEWARRPLHGWETGALRSAGMIGAGKWAVSPEWARRPLHGWKTGALRPGERRATAAGRRAGFDFNWSPKSETLGVGVYFCCAGVGICAKKYNTIVAQGGMRRISSVCVGGPRCVAVRTLLAADHGGVKWEMRR